MIRRCAVILRSSVIQRSGVIVRRGGSQRDLSTRRGPTSVRQRGAWSNYPDRCAWGENPASQTAAPKAARSDSSWPAEPSLAFLWVMYSA